MRKPGFFVVGAGRCGTTALWEYLRAHPRIFMPRVKEPRFFADDMPGLMNRVGTLGEYLRLFKGAAGEHLAVGEASPQYIYSGTAIGNIREFNPEAKLIVMLRNPVDMAHSAHAECLYWFVEDEPDFEKAWRLQPLRRKGLRVPKACGQVTVLLWADMCRLGRQVERLLGIFPREQAKFILFEDFVRDTGSVYEEVLAFLGVPSDGRREFPRVRATRTHRIAGLGRLLTNPPPALAGRLPPPLRGRVGVGGANRGPSPLPLAPSLKGRGDRCPLRALASLLSGWALRLNTVEMKREPLSPEFRRELVEEFREDVDKLSRLLWPRGDRDLSHWHR